MNIIRRFFATILIILTICSCHDSDTSLSKIQVSKATFSEIKQEGDQLAFTINSDLAWKISSDRIWCKPSLSTGKGATKINVILDTNEEYADRTANLTINAGNETKTISFTQKALVIGNDINSFRYKLPVVFHMIYEDRNNDKQYIKKGRVDEIIAAVNDLYKRSTDINIEFVLAKEDPNGKALEEPGVDRIQWNESTISCKDFMNAKDKTYKTWVWDNNKYINIFLYKFKEETTLGISYLPYTVGQDHLDGLNSLSFMPKQENLQFPYCLSINNEHIYAKQSNEQLKNFNPYDVASTLGHELGHFIGLHHAFNEDGDNTDVCINSDFCDDTPAYNRYEYEQFLDKTWPTIKNREDFLAKLNSLLERTDCTTKKITIPNNVMDYSVSFMNKITPHQKERIRYVLSHSPLIPGPKVVRTRTRAYDGKEPIPVQIKI